MIQGLGQLLEAAVHPTVVFERLDHASHGVTLDTCSPVMPGMQEEAAEKTDARGTKRGTDWLVDTPSYPAKPRHGA